MIRARVKEGGKDGKKGREGGAAEVGMSNEGKGSHSFAFCRLGQFKKSFVYPCKAPQGSTLMVRVALDARLPAHLFTFFTSSFTSSLTCPTPLFPPLTPSLPSSPPLFCSSFTSSAICLAQAFLSPVVWRRMASGGVQA